MKRSRIIVIIIVFVAAIAALWLFMRPEPIRVALFSIDKGTVEAIVSNTRAGTVKACRRTKMSPPAGGQIARLMVKKGQRVAANQVLLELWNKDLEAQQRLATQQLATSQNQARQACVLADLAGNDAERAKQLRERGFISAEGFETRAANARASGEACAAARSQIEQSRAQISMANATLERLVLRAPFPGIVADISGELGEYATPSPPGIPTPPAIDLIDDSCLYVSAPIDEMDASVLHPGESGRITLDAIKGHTFPAKVKRVAPYVLDLEKQARTVEVEMDFDRLPETGKLLVGYSADVEIIHDSHRDALRVPTPAILEGNRMLYYRPEDGMLEARTIATGLSNWEYTEVVSGLKQGDRIVLSLDRAGVKAGVRAVPDEARPAK